MADRLARHAQHRCELFLTDPPAGRERAVGYSRNKPFIGLVDQSRLRVEGLQRRAILNSEFNNSARGTPRQLGKSDAQRVLTGPRGLSEDRALRHLGAPIPAA